MSKHLCTLTIIFVVALAMTGCRTPDMPPGFQRTGGVLQSEQTSSTVSPMVVYALMQWYQQINAEEDVPELWQEYVAKQQQQALDSLNSQWRTALISRSAALFVPDQEKFIQIDPTALASRTNWESIKNQLYNLKVLLKAPRTYPIPADQATHDAFWNSKGRYDKEDFIAWAHQRTITLPDPSGLDRQTLIKQLDDIQTATHVKMTIVQAIQKANELTDKHKYFDALNLLDKTKQTYAPNQDALKALQDTHTIQLLNETLDLIPYSCLRHSLDTAKAILRQAQEKTQNGFNPTKNPIRVLDKMMAELETTVTAELQHWNRDKRYQHAKKKFQPEITQLLTDMAKLRLLTWKYILSQNISDIDYRKAMDNFLDFRKQLKIPNHSQLTLYSMETISPQSGLLFAEQIAQNVQAHMVSLLPKALDIISDAADMALKVNRKPGFAMGLCYLGRQMAQAANCQRQTDIKAKLQKLDQIFKQAEKTIEETVLKRVIAIADMSSAVPGMGITYTQDVIHALERLLKAFKIDHLVTIATTTVPLTRYSYSLYDGVVADFDGTETIERQNVRIVRRFGEIKKSPNPEAREDVTKPPHIFTQEVYEQLINVREIERLAHIRAFINLRGPGFTTLVEVNEFYSKRFIIEESHPFNDLRVIDVLKTYDLSQHPAQSAIPALVYDRVWTPGEMLDWARKDSLRVFTLKLIFHINQFPFLLESQAKHFEQDGNLQEATEFWAYCFALTEQINPDAANYSNILNETSKPAAKCYEQCIADLRQQRNEIIELKKNAHDMMTIKASKLLQSIKKH